jgi:hypothetical protein
VAAALLALCFAAPACSHRAFQYRPDGDELNRQRVRAGLALKLIEAQDVERLRAITDARGRKAMLVLAASLAYEKSDQVRQVVVMFVVFALLQGLVEPPTGEPLDWVAELTPIAQERLGPELGKLVGAGAGGILSGKLTFDSLATELSGGSAGPRPSGCVAAGAPVSYDVWLLRRLDWKRAEASRTFRAWKEDIRRLHLVEADCGAMRGLLLLTDYDDPAAPYLVAYRFFTLDQWAAVKPKLDRALGL